ncbi:MAG: hypothetical protein LC641_02930 [Spirochaeta sp.]|nr:hypothetical protein [Spirochaeta sp.]
MQQELSRRDRFIQHITLHSNFNRADDLASGFTHLFGALLSVVGTVLLVRQALTHHLRTHSWYLYSNHA